jgi:hypothetical protein
MKFTYLPCLGIRNGNKVSWRIYATEEEALADSVTARKEGEYWRQFGYEYGYCCPGSVRELPDGTWELCVA